MWEGMWSGTGVREGCGASNLTGASKDSLDTGGRVSAMREQEG